MTIQLLHSALQSRVTPSLSSSSRWPVAGLAFAGCLVSAYLALFQYGVLQHVWDPFFGLGSDKVLTAGLLDPISQAIGFPVHDAALGAVAYLFEAFLAITCLRGPAELHPRLVVGYSGFVLLMGGTSLALVALQAAVVHAWCTLCLASAAFSVVIVMLSVRELGASIGFLNRWWSKSA